MQKWLWMPKVYLYIFNILCCWVFFFKDLFRVQTPIRNVICLLQLSIIVLICDMQSFMFRSPDSGLYRRFSPRRQGGVSQRMMGNCDTLGSFLLIAMAAVFILFIFNGKKRRESLFIVSLPNTEVLRPIFEYSMFGFCAVCGQTRLWYTSVCVCQIWVKSKGQRNVIWVMLLLQCIGGPEAAWI